MAVSKNFVVKNGLEVGTNVIVADAQDLHVGLGTTAPSQTLDVRGDVRFSDGAQTNFFDVAGISTFRKDLNIGSAGTVFRADVNKGFIGIGSDIPRYALDVRSGAGVTLAASFDKSISAPGLTAPTINTDYLVSVASTTGSLYVSGIATVGTAASVYGTFAVSSLTNNRIPIVGAGSTIEDDANLVFDGATLDVGVNLDVDGRTELDTTNISETLNVAGITTLASSGGITTTGGDLYVGGDFSVTGVSTFGGNIDASGNLVTAAGGQFTGNITPATGEGIEIFVPTSGVGQVQSYDRTNTHWDILRFKGSKIDFYTKVGSSTTERMVLSEGGQLSVGSSFSVGQSGVVTATSFYGDGSNLTGVVATSGGSIGISSGGTVIGTGVTMVDFGNSGATITAPSSGVSTVVLPTGVSLGLAIALGS